MKINIFILTCLMLLSASAVYGQASDKELAAARAELREAQRVMRETSRRMSEISRQLGEKERSVALEFMGNRDRAMIGIVMGAAQADGGVVIAGVTPGGPAEAAGVEVGDVLVMVNGESLGKNDRRRGRNVSRILRGMKEGELVELVVERDGQVVEYAVTAERMEPRVWVQAPLAPSAPVSPTAPVIVPGWDFNFPEINLSHLEPELERMKEYLAENGELSEYVKELQRSLAPDIRLNVDRIGRIWGSGAAWRDLELAELNPDLGQYFGASSGVLVISVDEDSELALRGGDVLVKVEGNEVASPREAMRQLRKTDPGESVEVSVLRDRDELQLTLIVPEPRLPGYSYSYSFGNDAEAESESTESDRDDEN